MQTLQLQVQQNHGKTMVDEATLREMVELRTRVMELELGRSELPEVSEELLLEMEELR